MESYWQHIKKYSLGKDGNAHDILGTTSSTRGWTIGSFESCPRGCVKYDIITKLLR